MKRGQITIFVIIGLILVVAFFMLFFLKKSTYEIGHQPEIYKKGFLETCIEDKIKEGVDLISIQGGSITPTFFKKFDSQDGLGIINLSILCYNQNFYLPCINQQPMFLYHLDNELTDYIKDDVENCFHELALSIERQGYEVKSRYYGFDVKLQPKKIVLDINGEITITKSDETTKENNFEIMVLSEFYDLGVIVNEIVNQESRFCHFEHQGFMLLYNKFNIDRFNTGDGYNIYTIEHRKSKEKFRFATRGCVIPPGY